MTDKTLQERLREYGSKTCCVERTEAADALDAQAERIKALEGALREALRIDYEMEKGGGVSGSEIRAFRKRARALLGEQSNKPPKNTFTAL